MEIKPSAKFSFQKYNVYNSCQKLSKRRYQHYIRSVRIRSYSGPHFPAFWLNMERYEVFFSVFSPNAGKYGPFSCSVKSSAPVQLYLISLLFSEYFVHILSRIICVNKSLFVNRPAFPQSSFFCLFYNFKLCLSFLIQIWCVSVVEKFRN